MAIQILDNFQLLKSIPLDSRTVVNNTSDIPVSGRYNGMIVYQLSDEMFYVYKGGQFHIFDTNTGVTSFNGSTGDVVVVQGSGVIVNQFEPGKFRIELESSVIKSDGTVSMDAGYYPLNDRDVATLKYVQDMIYDSFSQHEAVVMSAAQLGHARIDDDSIKLNQDNQLILNRTDGGTF